MEGSLSVGRGVTHTVQGPADDVAKLGRNLSKVAAKINSMVAKGEVPSEKLEGQMTTALGGNLQLLNDPKVRAQLEPKFKEVAAAVIKLRQRPGSRLALIGLTAQLASVLPEMRGRTLDLDTVGGMATFIVATGVVKDEGGRSIKDLELATLLAQTIHDDFTSTGRLQEMLGQRPTSYPQFAKSWLSAHSDVQW